MSKRIWVVGRRISRRINGRLGGNPGHCLSTRLHAEERRVLEFIVNVIFIPWGWHHCRNSHRREIGERDGTDTSVRVHETAGRV